MCIVNRKENIIDSLDWITVLLLQDTSRVFFYIECGCFVCWIRKGWLWMAKSFLCFPLSPFGKITKKCFSFLPTKFSNAKERNVCLNYICRNRGTYVCTVVNFCLFGGYWTFYESVLAYFPHEFINLLCNHTFKKYSTQIINLKLCSWFLDFSFWSKAVPLKIKISFIWFPFQIPYISWGIFIPSSFGMLSS